MYKSLVIFHMPSEEICVLVLSLNTLQCLPSKPQSHLHYVYQVIIFETLARQKRTIDWSWWLRGFKGLCKMDWGRAYCRARTSATIRSPKASACQVALRNSTCCWRINQSKVTWDTMHTQQNQVVPSDNI